MKKLLFFIINNFEDKNGNYKYVNTGVSSIFSSLDTLGWRRNGF